MLKKNSLAVFLLLTVFTMSAQLTVNQWGQTRVGHDCDSIKCTMPNAAQA